MEKISSNIELNLSENVSVGVGISMLVAEKIGSLRIDPWGVVYSLSKLVQGCVVYTVGYDSPAPSQAKNGGLYSRT